jgi:reactive chlorine resistance protein C
MANGIYFRRRRVLMFAAHRRSHRAATPSKEGLPHDCVPEQFESRRDREAFDVVIGWIGALKFANFEAHQIQPLVANSPFMGWLYDIFPVYTFSALLGVFEVTAAVLLAIKPVAPKLSVVGSLQAIVLFLATTSFLFTTPGIGEPAGGGFPAISLIAEFLLKDIPLLGLSFWTLADSLRAAGVRTAD